MSYADKGSMSYADKDSYSEKNEAKSANGESSGWIDYTGNATQSEIPIFSQFYPIVLSAQTTDIV